MWTEDLHAQLSGRTLLLTGGAGFLGRYLLGIAAHLNEHALEQPLRVIALDNFLVSEPPEMSSPYHQFVRHNVIEKYLTDEPIDYVGLRTS